MKNREIYLKRLLDFKDLKFIKVITGIRRSGKSTLLKLFAKELTRKYKIPKKNILEINFESGKYNDILDSALLYDYVKGEIKGIKGKIYLMFDEVQMVKDWERAVNSFSVDFNVDIYITGSNAYLLSSELSTFLSGRYVEIKMLPLSYKEFLVFNNLESNDRNFDLFLRYGGMPVIDLSTMDEQVINNALEGIYHTAIFKDIMEKNNITDEQLLKNLVLYLADNIGNISSPNNITNYLSSNRKHLFSRDSDIGHRTVGSYISALEKAFIFYPVFRYDIKGKEYLKTLQKYYIVDTGIRNMLLGYRDVDRGHILENVVYLELLRRGYKVSIGKVGAKEVDFVATKPDEKVYFQVTESLLDKSVKERELSALQSIRDNHEKTILSMDVNFVMSEDGIKLRNIIDFLLEE